MITFPTLNLRRNRRVAQVKSVKIPSLPLPGLFSEALLPWEEPFRIFKRLARRNPLIFLDSAAVSASGDSRRSFIAWDPWLWIRGKKDSLLLKEGRDAWKTLKTSSPYECFRKIFKNLQASNSFPEAAGAYGVFHYETGEFFERLPESPRSGKRDYFEFIFPRQILVFDHSLQKLTHIALGKASAVLSLPEDCRRPQDNHRPRVSGLKAQFTQKKFETMVKKAKDYIRAGDIYQANLSQDFSFDFQGDPVLVYENLRSLNPSPYSSFFKLGHQTLLSSSPELLLRKVGERCLTRPIAGTRPRGRNSKEDRSHSRALLLSPKEKAEHLMLLDLERNDLGKVCDYETVQVEEAMALERYSHVIHIVSQVSGKIRRGQDNFDLIRALFPGGTITGCPKIRSMEIIHELEKKPREFYTGSLGFLGFSGNALFNIIIRTIVLDGNRGSLRVGAGIVADSNPSREYEETLQKGKALFEALGVKGMAG